MGGFRCLRLRRGLLSPPPAPPRASETGNGVKPRIYPGGWEERESPQNPFQRIGCEAGRIPSRDTMNIFEKLRPKLRGTPVEAKTQLIPRPYVLEK